MLAEAYAEIGNEAMSKQVLNQLLAARTREGASLLTCDNYKSGLALKDLIKLQWRIEMWGKVESSSIMLNAGIHQLIVQGLKFIGQLLVIVRFLLSI